MHRTLLDPAGYILTEVTEGFAKPRAKPRPAPAAERGAVERRLALMAAERAAERAAAEPAPPSAADEPPGGGLQIFVPRVGRVRHVVRSRPSPDARALRPKAPGGDEPPPPPHAFAAQYLLQQRQWEEEQEEEQEPPPQELPPPRKQRPPRPAAALSRLSRPIGAVGLDGLRLSPRPVTSVQYVGSAATEPPAAEARPATSSVAAASGSEPLPASCRYLW